MSYGGIGFGLKGFTRVDATGYCFATRWFMLFNLPIVPLGRYYLRELGLRPGSNHLETTTKYEIAGTAELHPGEILRTYAYSWLGTAAVIVPLLAFLAAVGDDAGLVTLAAIVLWPMLGIFISVMALMHYRKRWAPEREVFWREPADPAP